MTTPRVVVVDTGSGNLRSVEKALEAAGSPHTQVTSDADVVARADKIVVPGQGAFGGCARGLEGGGGALRAAVLDGIQRGVPFFGICVGMQLLFEGSDESPDCRGLGVFAGRVVRFDVAPPLKVPHMGWNQCRRGPAAAHTKVLRDTPDGTSFYFVHSFFPVPGDPAVVALETDHGQRFAAAVARDNVFACQFHPEKSQRAGLALLERFVAL